jgi:FkbM family methyltransferase
MIRKPFEIVVDFAAGGNSEAYTLNGWCRPERLYTFNDGHEARLMLPKLFDSDRYDLSVDVWPFVARDRLPIQHLEVIVRGTQVMHVAVDNRERRVMGCEIPPRVIEGCESVDITFRFPDAAAPASVTDDSLDRRVVAFAFFSLKLSGRLVGDEATIHEETEVSQHTPASPDPARIRLIDVGAMGGIQAKWQPHLESITPVLFEPNPKEADELRTRFPYALVVEAALSNVTGRRNLIVTENPTCISLRHPNQEFLANYDIHPHLRVTGTQEVECTRYDALHQQGSVPNPDVIKLDVQGCEYEVLLGFGALLQDCLGIELETHFYPAYREQRLLHEIITLLDAYGFVLRKLDQNKMDHFDGDLVEVDAFFTKPRSVVRSYDQVQRRKFDLLTDVWQLAHYRL